MDDLKPFKHSDEGKGSTHAVCQNRLDKEGGKSMCCSCEPHEDCNLNSSKPQENDLKEEWGIGAGNQEALIKQRIYNILDSMIVNPRSIDVAYENLAQLLKEAEERMLTKLDIAQSKTQAFNQGKKAGREEKFIVIPSSRMAGRLSSQLLEFYGWCKQGMNVVFSMPEGDIYSPEAFKIQIAEAKEAGKKAGIKMAVGAIPNCVTVNDWSDDKTPREVNLEPLLNEILNKLLGGKL